VQIDQDHPKPIISHEHPGPDQSYPASEGYDVRKGLFPTFFDTKGAVFHLPHEKGAVVTMIHEKGPALDIMRKVIFIAFAT
jgi:hypothetical protein